MLKIILSVMLAALFAGGSSPQGSGCELHGCKTWQYAYEAYPGSISGNCPAEDDPSQGACECQSGKCIETDNKCVADWMVTFTAPPGKVLCNGTTSYGANETVTLSVKECGEAHSVSFAVKSVDCSSPVEQIMMVKYGCRDCTGASCPP